MGLRTGPARPQMRSHRQLRRAPRPRRDFVPCLHMRDHPGFCPGRAAQRRAARGRIDGSSSHARPRQRQRRPHSLQQLLSSGEVERVSWTHCQEVLWLDLGVERYRAHDVIVLKGVKCFARIGVPDLPASTSASSISQRYKKHAYAVKSALPVMAREVSSEILDDQTAPL